MIILILFTKSIIPGKHFLIKVGASSINLDNLPVRYLHDITRSGINHGRSRDDTVRLGIKSSNVLGEQLREVLNNYWR